MGVTLTKTLSFHRKEDVVLLSNHWLLDLDSNIAHSYWLKATASKQANRYLLGNQETAKVIVGIATMFIAAIGNTP